MNRLIFVTKENCTSCDASRPLIEEIANSENIEYIELRPNSFFRDKYNLSPFLSPDLLLIDEFGDLIQKWGPTQLTAPAIEFGGLAASIRELNGGALPPVVDPGTDTDIEIITPPITTQSSSISKQLILAALGIGAFLYFRES